MTSTPPPIYPRREDVRWYRWVEEQVNSNSLDIANVNVRARAAQVQAASTAGRVAQQGQDIEPSLKVSVKPDGLTLISNVGGWNPDGTVYSTVVLEWNNVGLATDGTVVQAAEYEVWQSVDSGPITRVTASRTPHASLNTAAGVAIDFRVRARPEGGGWGEYSDPLQVVTAEPSPTLGTPSKPTLTSGSGSVVIAWDGLLDGTPAPHWMDRVLVQRQAGAAWVTLGSMVEGRFTDAGLSRGDDHTYRLIARDKLGRTSSPSATETITVVGVGVPDIDSAIIDAIDQAQQDADAAFSSSGEVVRYGYFQNGGLWGGSGGVLYPVLGTYNWLVGARVSDGNISYVAETGNRGPISVAPIAVGTTLEITLSLINGSSAPRDITLTVGPLGGDEDVYTYSIPPGVEHTVTQRWTNESTNNFVSFLVNTGAMNGVDEYLLIHSLSAKDVTALAAVEDTADTALSTANGKNKVIFSTSAASGTDYSEGDIWFRRSGSLIIGQWEFTGSAWAARTIDNAVIANLDAGKITTGFLDVANRVQAGSITTSKLVVADMENLLDDPEFDAGTWNSLDANKTIVSITDHPVRGNAKVLQIVATSSGQAVQNDRWVPCEPGDMFYGEAWVRKTTNDNSGQARIDVQFRKKDGSFMYPSFANQGLGGLTVDQWVKISGTVEAPADVYEVRMRLLLPAGTSSGTVQFASPRMRRMATANLIVDGAITAQKLNAAEIWANEAWLDTLRAGVIEVDMVTPGFGESLSISANDAVTIMAGQVDAMQAEIDAHDTTLEDLQGDVSNAASAAGTAQSSADSANAAASLAAAAAAAAQAGVEDQALYLRISEEHVEVGRPESSSAVRISDESVSITANGVATTYWDGGQMIVGEISVDKARIANLSVEEYGAGTVFKVVEG